MAEAVVFPVLQFPRRVSLLATASVPRYRGVGTIGRRNHRSRKRRGHRRHRSHGPPTVVLHFKTAAAGGGLLARLPFVVCQRGKGIQRVVGLVQDLVHDLVPAFVPAFFVGGGGDRVQDVIGHVHACNF